MLVLSRKKNQRICIGSGITITVTRVAGNRVTLGIEAPRNVKIDRGEVRLRDAQRERFGRATKEFTSEVIDSEQRTATAPLQVVPG